MIWRAPMDLTNTSARIARHAHSICMPRTMAPTRAPRLNSLVCRTSAAGSRVVLAQVAKRRLLDLHARSADNSGHGVYLCL
jgi:hypothetical protein